MLPKDEIKQLRKDIQALRKELILVELMRDEAEKSEERIVNGLSASLFFDGLAEQAKDLVSTHDRAIYEYQRAIEYFEARIGALQSLARREKYKLDKEITFSATMKTPEEEDESLKAEIKSKPIEDIEKFFKSRKPKQIFFTELERQKRFRVFCGSQAIGTIRKARTKYQSDTKVVFTKEALDTRSFVKDGKLQVEEKAVMSNTKEKLWKIGNEAEGFRSFEQAVKELAKRNGINGRLII